jgi:hypothetical protein
MSDVRYDPTRDWGALPIAPPLEDSSFTRPEPPAAHAVLREWADELQGIADGASENIGVSDATRQTWIAHMMRNLADRLEADSPGTRIERRATPR